MSILKHVSGSNCDPDYINVLVDYMTENHKTADGLYVDTYGCSKTNPVRDIDAVKKIHHKTGGKQGEHFVLSITPDKISLKYRKIHQNRNLTDCYKPTCTHKKNKISKCVYNNYCKNSRSVI